MKRHQPLSATPRSLAAAKKNPSPGRGNTYLIGLITLVESALPRGASLCSFPSTRTPRAAQGGRTDGRPLCRRLSRFSSGRDPSAGPPSPLRAISFHAAASLCKSPARMLSATTFRSPECRCSPHPSRGAGGYFPSAAFSSELPHGLFPATRRHIFSIPRDCQWPQFRSQVYLPAPSTPVAKRSLYVKKTPHLCSQLPAAISSPHGAGKAMFWPAAILREADAPPDPACLDTG